MNKLKAFQMSPIVLKELRQAVRGRFIPVLLCAYLLIQVLVMMGNSSNTASATFGYQLLLSNLTVLAVVVLVLVPFTVGLRHCLERNNDQMDLLYISALPPKQIITGKFLAGMMTNLLFFSASLPFISLTLLLRGVDIQMIVILTLAILLAAPLVLQAAITAASIPMSRILQVLVGLAGLGALFIYLGLVLGILFNGMRTSFLGSGLSGLLELKVFVGIGLVLLFTYLLQTIGTALIQPSSANRARPIRQTATLGWALSLATALLSGDKDALEVWAVIISTFLFLSAGFIASERTEINPRLRNDIPRRPLPRIWHFLMSSGQANGMIWLFLHSVATISLLGFVSDREVIYGVSALCLAGIGYGFWGIFLYRRFFFRVVPKGKAFLVPLLLFALGTGLPVLLGLLIDPTANWRKHAILHVLNPIAAFDYSTWQMTIATCLAVMAFLGILLNVSAIRATVRDYKPSLKAGVSP